MDILEIKGFLIFSLMSFIAGNEDYLCNINKSPSSVRYNQNGNRYRVAPTENTTCKNMEQMHATRHICSEKCTITFTGNIDIVRTNSFSLLDNLDQVFLNNTGIETIQSKSFSGIHSIKRIHLGRNRINKIPIYAFYQLQNLESLDLSVNRIEDIKEESFNGCMSLKDLDLSSNRLRNLSTTVLESLLKLETLNLSRNALKIMDQNMCLHLYSLKYLVLDHNNISSMLNCTSNYNIKILSISYNNLVALDGPLFPTNSEKLNLSGNHIALIQNEPFQHLTRLEILDLSKNNLNHLPFDLFRNLKNLNYLDISSNNIVTLNEGVFHGLTSLKFLNLSGINSPDLEASVFYSTRNVNTIDISGNNMTYFDIGILFKLCPKLKYLGIDRNSFTCPDLAQMFLSADERKISIIPGRSFKSNNLNGIGCDHLPERTQNNGTSNQVSEYFERGFRKSSFFKFFSKFQQPSQNNGVEFVELQKYLIKNISDGIDKTEERISKKIYTVQENLRRMDRTNELLQKLMKTIESNESGKTTNLSSELFKILDQQSQAASTAENTDMTNIIASLNNLKFIFVAFIFILILIGVVKLFRQLKPYLPINKYVIDTQELPFIKRSNTRT